MESRQFYKNDINSLKLILEAHVEPQRGITESGFVVAKQSKPEGAVAEQSTSDAHCRRGEEDEGTVWQLQDSMPLCQPRFNLAGQAHRIACKAYGPVAPNESPQ